MDFSAAILKAHEIVNEAGTEQKGSLRLTNLLDYLDLTVDVIKSWSTERRSIEPDLKDLLTAYARLRDDAGKIVAADPVILYKPQHNVAEEFHRSLALFRYFWGGNRISKTQAGCADNAWILTGRHPHRRKNKPGSVFIVGTDYQHYKLTYEKKYVIGEPDNPLSPLFPEGGKWLHHYDKKGYILYIACPECANRGAATSCKHLQTLSLHSDKSDRLGLAGGQYAQGQFDEPVSEPYFHEAKQRLKTVKESSLVITETPVLGENHWSYQILYKIGTEGGTKNWLETENRPMISLHTIDQLSAGLTPPEQVIADARTMPEHEFLCRIMGRHVNADTKAIFDLKILFEMQQQCRNPEFGDLRFVGEGKHKNLENFLARPTDEPYEIVFLPEEDGPIQLWEPPIAGEQYIIGGDSAEGLADGDGSVAWCLKMVPKWEQIAFEQVALIDCRLDTRKYADALYRLGAWYGEAALVLENNSFGAAVILHLIEALNCPFVFRDQASPIQANGNISASYGLNTNIRSKKMLISILQSTIRARAEGHPSIDIYSRIGLGQLQSYVQEKNKTGTGWVMKGSGTSKDDHVIAAALGVYAGTTQSVYDFERRLIWEKEAKASRKNLSEHEKAVWELLRAQEESSENSTERDML